MSELTAMKNPFLSLLHTQTHSGLHQLDSSLQRLENALPQPYKLSVHLDSTSPFIIGHLGLVLPEILHPVAWELDINCKYFNHIYQKFWSTFHQQEESATGVGQRYLRSECFPNTKKQMNTLFYTGIINITQI